MIIQRAQALGCQALFALEGAAFANSSIGGGAGVVSSTSAPASNDPAFVPLTVIEEWEDKPTSKEVKTMAPAPSILVPKRTVTVSQEMAYNFTGNEVSALALQIFYRTSQALVQGSTQFNPLSGKPPHGFLLLMRYSTEGDQANPYWIGLIWVFMKVTGGMKGGDNLILKPTFEADQMYSPLNDVNTLQQS
jgi:hypothetical protein